MDYLDEALPGSFRQAQVCFSSLIPKAMPTCDAVTMEPYMWLYCDYGRLKLGALLESEDSGTGSAMESRYRISPAYTANAMGRNSAGRSDNMLTPNVLMLTKHTNGSLNLWQVYRHRCSLHCLYSIILQFVRHALLNVSYYCSQYINFLILI